MEPPESPFDIEAFLALPRVSGLALSPDGRRLVTSVATVAADAKRFVTCLWELDPEGRRQPRRLTRSDQGEHSPTFLPDGGLLFLSTRPPAGGAGPPGTGPEDIDGQPDKGSDTAALWLLEPEGGEARQLASVPGGIEGVTAARRAGTLAVAAGVMVGVDGLDEDRAKAAARRQAGVDALLFEAYPIRRWDHWLGPRQRHLLIGPGPATGAEAEARVDLADLTPGVGSALEREDLSFDLTPDGRTLVTSWATSDVYVELVAIDTATGERRTLSGGEVVQDSPACSPNGRWVVSVRELPGTPEAAAQDTLWLVDLQDPADGGRDLTPDLDRWPHAPVWAPDSSAIYFTCDEEGKVPAWRVELATGRLTRLCADGALSDLCPSPDGDRLYALRSTVGSPPEVVVLGTSTSDQAAKVLPSPGVPLPHAPVVEELWATALDGRPVHSWLVLPTAASPEGPAPLVVFIHGGPLSSWSGWHWRWSPHLLAARGYAVLLPDPALSTGYGQGFIQRGWGRWGGPPFSDLMAAVEHAATRPDIDGDRVAAMGGSFGGYMANWAAGHTGRFSAIVTHASLWALDQFQGTTDLGVWLAHEMGDVYRDLEPFRANSPHLAIESIHTPMLVIHGELDHRVPIGEALRLWTDLSVHGVEAKLLYFPDENHWVRKPQNVRIWYETVLAFLDHHLLGEGWRRPGLL